FIVDPCDDCIIRNGVGFNPHPNDCAKFTHCVRGADNKMVATFRSCPFSQYWDQTVLTCRKSEDVPCIHEKCRAYMRTHPMTNTDNCRAYWQCKKGISIGTCCKEGQMYVPNKGCIRDLIGVCSDACPPVTYEHSSCDSREITGDPKRYERYIPGQGWVKMPCPMGTHYQHSSCGCAVHVSFKNETTQAVCRPELYLPFDTDLRDKSGNNLHVENHGVVIREGAAYFNGQAQLVIPRFSSFQYRDLVITMKFYENPPTGNLVPLMSNSNFCKSNISLALIKSKQSIHFFAKLDTGKSTTFGLPMKVGKWNQVYYVHDGQILEGSSNGMKAEKSAIGKLQSTHTPIHIGFGKGRSKFKGYMDEKRKSKKNIFIDVSPFLKVIARFLQKSSSADGRGTFPDEVPHGIGKYGCVQNVRGYEREQIKRKPYRSLSDFTEPTDVAVIEETKQIKLGKNGLMPDNLDFNLNLVHGSKPVTLHLNRNGLGNEGKQVAVVRRYRNGTVVMVQEHIPKVKVSIFETLY
ncbi:hypothetical protein FSP39_010582, partial [Pinctada imbricata]